MTDRILNPVGAEANPQRGGRFEDQVVRMGTSLGWRTICRNSDIFVANNGQAESKGVDVLFAVENPVTGRDEGLLSEAKVHGKQTPGSLLTETQTLREKIVRIDRSRIRELPQARRMHTLRTGLLVHRTHEYEPERMAIALADLDPRPRVRGPAVPRIGFAGPDKLNALADCFTLTGAGTEFFWPGTGRRIGAWSKAAPPRQIAHGMLVYKTGPGQTVLWVAAGLSHLDAAAYAELGWHYELSFDRVVCSYLSDDVWQTLRDPWRYVAELHRDRSFGRLPDSVEARDLSCARMTNFDDLWPHE